MALDAFSEQIVNMVRNMPAEAILALVKNQLSAVTGGGAIAAAQGPRRTRGRTQAAPAAPAKAAPVAKRGAPVKRRAGRPRGSQGTSAERQQTLEAVERAVKASSGLSASEVASQTGIPQQRVASALKELKLAKRIYQGGDRRFARYAGDAKTAEQASLNARKNASGPMSSKKAAAAAKGRKRGSASSAAK